VDGGALALTGGGRSAFGGGPNSGAAIDSSIAAGAASWVFEFRDAGSLTNFVLDPPDRPSDPSGSSGADLLGESRVLDALLRSTGASAIATAASTACIGADGALVFRDGRKLISHWGHLTRLPAGWLGGISSAVRQNGQAPWVVADTNTPDGGASAVNFPWHLLHCTFLRTGKVPSANLSAARQKGQASALGAFTNVNGV
jgi:hypothetical protein